MMRKLKKSAKGPSWLEVIIGAILSLALGIVLGAVYLVGKPVTSVKELPRDAQPGAVYYIEGSRDFDKAVVVAEKRKRLVAGKTVAVTEGELNAFIVSLSPAAAAPGPAPKPLKPGEKPPPPPPADVKTFDPGPLNVRIRAGSIQFSDTITYNILGVTDTIVVQAKGAFARRGSVFVFVPESVYVGGCPLQKIPLARDWIVDELLSLQPVPNDLSSAWFRLSDVSIDGSTLRLKMP